MLYKYDYTFKLNTWIYIKNTNSILSKHSSNESLQSQVNAWGHSPMLLPARNVILPTLAGKVITSQQAFLLKFAPQSEATINRGLSKIKFASYNSITFSPSHLITIPSSVEHFHTGYDCEPDLCSITEMRGILCHDFVPELLFHVCQKAHISTFTLSCIPQQISDPVKNCNL